tara:strand:- start:383 stop:532 length:150 start_codon:yes stop_codon:yes gene_type:complete
MKYKVTLSSGRDFILEAEDNDWEEMLYEANEEACLHDDYLENLEPIHDA